MGHRQSRRIGTRLTQHGKRCFLNQDHPNSHPSWDPVGIILQDRLQSSLAYRNAQAYTTHTNSLKSSTYSIILNQCAAGWERFKKKKKKNLNLENCTDMQSLGRTENSANPSPHLSKLLRRDRTGPDGMRVENFSLRVLELPGISYGRPPPGESQQTTNN